MALSFAAVRQDCRPANPALITVFADSVDESWINALRLTALGPLL